VTRGVVRSALLLGLAVVAVSWSRDESSAGNRSFLLLLAVLLGLVALWGMIETVRELKRIRTGSAR